MTTKIYRARLALGCVASLSACAGADEAAEDDSGPAASETGTDVDNEVSIFSFWEQAGEQAALDALSSVFRDQNPNVNVRLVSEFFIDTTPTVGLLAKYETGEVFDVAVVFPPELHLLTHFDDGSGPRSLLRDLTDVLASSGANEAIPETILRGAQREGVPYVAPVGLHRVNTLFYNKTVLENVGAPAPETLAEFVHLCEAVDIYNRDRPEHEHVYALSTPTIGWTLDIMFHSIISGGADAVHRGSGGAYVHKFFQGQASIDDPEFLAAAHALNSILQCANQPEAVYSHACHGGDAPGEACLSDADCGDGGSCPATICQGGANEGAPCSEDSTCGEGTCADNDHQGLDAGPNASLGLFFDDRVATILTGDWVKGTLDAAGFAEYGMMAAFGSESLFLYNIDSFATFEDVPHPRSAEAFMQIALGPEGQAAFNILKGSTPPRQDTPLDGFDAAARATIDQYRNAEHLMSIDATFGWSGSSVILDYWRMRYQDGFASSGTQYGADMDWLLARFRERYEIVKAARPPS